MDRSFPGDEVKTAVITGGHSFDVPHFHQLFHSLEGVAAYVQSLDDFASSPKEVRQAYDVALFYTMMMPTPTDEGLPWYAGRPLTALSELGETSQGLVVLHHALLAYPQWLVWNEIVGIPDRQFGYHVGQAVDCGIATPDHPITRDLQPWAMVDETYVMGDAGPGSTVLITYSHPRSMRTIAWTRQYRASRVFCYQAGHDNATWPDPSFREVLRRGILWAAGRLQRDET